MTTIDVRIHRRIEVPDEVVVLSDHYLQRGEEVIDVTKTAKAVLDDPDSLVEAHIVGTIVLAPDPDEVADYEASVAEFERQREARDVKRLVGAPDLPTDDELREQFPIEDPPTIVPTCNLCGSADFRYDESSYSSSRGCDVKTDDDGVLLTFSGSSGGDGDSWPGVVCDNCDAALDLPDNIDIEWGF